MRGFTEDSDAGTVPVTVDALGEEAHAGTG